MNEFLWFVLGFLAGGALATGITYRFFLLVVGRIIKDLEPEKTQHETIVLPSIPVDSKIPPRYGVRIDNDKKDKK